MNLLKKLRLKVKKKNGIKLSPSQWKVLRISLKESYDEANMISYEELKIQTSKHKYRPQLIKKLKEKSIAKEIVLTSGATKEDIEKLEHQLDIKLPNDIKAFFLFTNGFDANDHYMFRVPPIDEIIDEWFHKNKNEFRIAEYLIYSEYWVIEFDSKESNQYSITNSSKSHILTNSFEIFIDRFLEKGVNGLEDWAEEMSS